MATYYVTPTGSGGTASYVWTEWCGTTTSASTTGNTWIRWVNTSASTTNTVTTVWYEWNDTASEYTHHRPVQPKPLSAEEQAKRDAELQRQAEEARRKMAEFAEEKRKADERASELLTRHLSIRQRRAYRRHKAFVVRARDGTRFRLRHGWAGNVEELNKAGRPVNRFCIHPQEQVPYADNLLAQKLMLETDPDAFRRIANRTAIPQAA